MSIILRQKSYKLSVCVCENITRGDSTKLVILDVFIFSDTTVNDARIKMGIV